MSAEASRSGNMPSLAAMTESLLLKSLSQAVGEADKKAAFACGGKIPIVLNPPLDSSGNVTPRTAGKMMDQVITTESITIRYGPQGKGQILRLPTDTSRDPAFLRLISSCEPATFGLDGKDVYDESYRKATKLDTTDFVSDFCPYRTGILDIVTQFLMPGISKDVAKYIEGLQKPPPKPEAHIVPQKIQVDVKALFLATAAYVGTDELVVCNIISSRSNEELCAINRLFNVKYQLDLEYVIGTKVREPLSMVLLGILRAAIAEEQEAVSREVDTEAAGKGIRAELYKLNVYSGPSGKIKAHVDTPRSETQIGSLVVCFPSDFEGGALSVRHQGNTLNFDWSASSNPEPTIQWAAFYSDCEHEVHEVTSGHRINLSYNLYASNGTGLLAGQKHSLDATQLPLYQSLMDAVETPEFMTQGGTIGIKLSHSYPHTHPKLYRSMPAALRGVDMMLYETLLASKIDFKLVRIIEMDSCEAYQEGFDGMDVEEGMVDEMEVSERFLGWKRFEEDEVEWLRWNGHEELESAFLAYGNQAEMSTKYSQAAIIINIQPFLERKTRFENSTAE